MAVHGSRFCGSSNHHWKDEKKIGDGGKEWMLQIMEVLRIEQNQTATFGVKAGGSHAGTCLGV